MDWRDIAILALLIYAIGNGWWAAGVDKRLRDIENK